MSILRLRNLATLFIEQQLTDNINFDIAIEEIANKKARKVTVENCSFHFTNKVGPNFLYIFTIFPHMSFLLFV